MKNDPLENNKNNSDNEDTDGSKNDATRGDTEQSSGSTESGSTESDSAESDSAGEESFGEEPHNESLQKITNGIVVSALPTYLPERSEHEKAIYAHSYRINIENRSQVAAQLINRHWKVISGGKQIADVKGEGVIGEQPVLQPGETFEYESWTVVKDPIGSMVGTYTFVSEEGDFFDVEIPEFPLIHIEDMTVH